MSLLWVLYRDLTRAGARTENWRPIHFWESWNGLWLHNWRYLWAVASLTFARSKVWESQLPEVESWHRVALKETLSKEWSARGQHSDIVERTRRRRGRGVWAGQPMKKPCLYSRSCGLKAQQGVSVKPVTVLKKENSLQTPASPEEHNTILIQYQSDGSCPILSSFLAFLLTLYPHPPQLWLWWRKKLV